MLEIQTPALLMQSVLLLVIGIVPWVTTIRTFADAIRVPSDSQYRAGTKLIWVLVILFLNCLGAIIYYAVGRPPTKY